MKCLNPRYLRDVDRGIYVCVPCGQCLACQSNRRQQWYLRLKFETEQYINKCCFCTLTYDDDHYPSDGMLNYRDFQLFLKRLRKDISPLKIKFFACGEYGETTLRAHYHCIIFGLSCDEAKKNIGEKWSNGFVQISPLNDARIKYTVKYILKQADFKEKFPNFVKPFIRCSQGLGLTTFLKNEEYFLNQGGVKIDGHYSSTPRYFGNKSPRFKDRNYVDLDMNDIAVRLDLSHQAKDDWNESNETSEQRKINFEKRLNLFSKKDII